MLGFIREMPHRVALEMPPRDMTKSLFQTSGWP